MRRIVLFLIASLVALAIFGVAGAVQDPRVVRYSVVLDKLPPGSAPIRIVQLSDTHGSWIDMPPVRLERIVAQANALKPDLVVLTGDYIGGKLVDWPRIRLEKVLLPLAALHAPLGVYAVPGNHDTVRWTRFVFAKTQVHFLIDRWIDAGPLVVAGTNDYSNILSIDPSPAVRGLQTAKPVILLAHEPDFFTLLPPIVDLMICGHTHGGQIKLPLIGAPAYPRGYPLLRGEQTRGQQTLIISSGVGTSVIPVRIGVSPEIVEITLVPRPAGPPAYSTGRKSGTDR